MSILSLLEPNHVPTLSPASHKFTEELQNESRRSCQSCQSLTHMPHTGYFLKQQCTFLPKNLHLQICVDTFCFSHPKWKLHLPLVTEWRILEKPHIHITLLVYFAKINLIRWQLQAHLQLSNIGYFLKTPTIKGILK